MNKLTLVAVLFATGCGFGPPDTDRTIRTDSSGIEIIANTGADLPLDWRFEPVWSIGGSGDERLGVPELHPHHIATDGGERVYVLEEAAHRVLVFSADGAVVDTLGGEGGGPGELSAPVSIAVGADGVVAVYDYGKGGLVRWAADGTLLDFVRIESRFWGPKIEVATEGVLFTALDSDGDNPSRQRLALWSPDADRSLARLVRMADRLADFPTCGVRGIPIVPLFAPELVWDSEGGRVAVNAGAPYVIDLYQAGRRVRSIRRTIAPRPVDERMALREVGDGLPIPVANCTVPPEEVVRGRGYAEVVPSVRALTLSPTAELWVLRGHVADEPAGVDVFGRDGGYLGTLPPGSPFPVAFPGERRILTVEKDSLDVPRIVLYRVSRP